MTTFKAYDLRKEVIEASSKLGYVEPTSIQQLVIPKVLAGKSLVVKSETGSGKTHSFLIPIINSINMDECSLQALILAPTIELAKQIYDFAKQYCTFFEKLNIKLVSSTIEKTRNISDLKTNPQIVVATCGRAHDLLCDESYISFSKLKFLVLDEADMIMDNGFINDVDEIISKVNPPQILVFSATISQSLQNVFSKYIKSDFFITSDNTKQTSKNVSHFAIDTKHVPLNECILKFLRAHPAYFVLIFVSNKENIQPIVSFLNKHEYSCCGYHGDLEKRQRKTLIKRIKNEEFQIVVCSDIAARGIDLPTVDVVLSVDLPNNLEFYFHRAGRTGRYESKGESFIFYDNDNTKSIDSLLNSGLELKFLKFAGETLVDGKYVNTKRVFKKKENVELTKEIKKARSLASSKKVKPGYKKKMKRAEDKVKSQFRQDIIKKDIKRQKKEKYRKLGKGYEE